MFFTTCTSSCLKEKFKAALVWLDSSSGGGKPGLDAQRGLQWVLSQAVRGDRHSDPCGINSPLPSWGQGNPGSGEGEVTFPGSPHEAMTQWQGSLVPVPQWARGKREFTKSGCQIGVLLANREVSVKLICLLLSKKGKKKNNLLFHSMLMKMQGSLSFFLIKSLDEWKNIFAHQADGVSGTDVSDFWFGAAAAGLQDKGVLICDILSFKQNYCIGGLKWCSWSRRPLCNHTLISLAALP